MIIPLGFAQVSFIHTIANTARPAVCTLGLNVGQAGGTITDQAEILRTAWSDEIMAAISDDAQLTGVHLKYGPNATGQAVLIPAATTGSDSGEAGAPNTAFLVRKVTGEGGRTGRGRFFIPGVPEGSINSGGVISGGKRELLQQNLDNFWDDLVANDLDPVLLHGEGVVAESPYLITQFAVQERAATQRRRLRK